MVIHQDSKPVPDLASGKGVSQLLTDTKLPSETGEGQASAVFGVIEDWNSNQVICFDATSSNMQNCWCVCASGEKAWQGVSVLSMSNSYYGTHSSCCISCKFGWDQHMLQRFFSLRNFKRNAG